MSTPLRIADMTASLRDRYLAAQDFSEVLGTVVKNADLWAGVWKHVVVPPSYVDRVTALGGEWHLLALSEDWCGDAVNTLPVVAKLAELAPNVDLRVLGRDANEDLMAAHLTGLSRSIPVVMALDADYLERGWWGPRPSQLQAWVLGDGQALDKTERYRQIRTWYARDHGRTTLDELVSMMERAEG